MMTAHRNLRERYKDKERCGEKPGRECDKLKRERHKLQWAIGGEQHVDCA